MSRVPFIYQPLPKDTTDSLVAVLEQTFQTLSYALQGIESELDDALDKDIDGGAAATVYALPDDVIDGGTASG